MEKEKIKRISLSSKDLEKLENSNYGLPTCDNEKYLGTVINKPWGYEYVLFQNKEISIWLLHIKKGFSTSMHCHPHKKTSLLVLSGEAQFKTLDGISNLKEEEGRIINKGVFHSTGAISEEGILLIEVETPVNKEDLFRLEDPYKREQMKYIHEKDINSKTNTYPYFFIKDKIGEKIIFEKYNSLIKEYSNKQIFIEDFKEIRSEIGILLEGEINNGENNFSKGDLLNFENFENFEFNSEIKILFLKNIIKRLEND